MSTHNPEEKEIESTEVPGTASEQASPTDAAPQIDTEPAKSGETSTPVPAEEDVIIIDEDGPGREVAMVPEHIKN